eukprot:93040-Pelagomonas_calceolata.AAC.1
MDTTYIALPDARDPFHDLHWLTLKSSYERNGDPHHSHTAPTHRLTNLTYKLKKHLHKRHKLDPADTSGCYYNSGQRLNYTTQPSPPNTTANMKSHNPPSQLAIDNKEITHRFCDKTKTP